jgi:4-hydroxybenzoate polyprenyltransferase
MKTSKLLLYSQLMRLNRPIGILLLLWPTLWALWIAAEGAPNQAIVLVFVLGTILMRSAGCVINDYADREIDPHVRRTADRPLACKQVTSQEALTLAAVLCILAFLCIMPLNRLTWLLSLPAVLLAGSYPWTKRFFAIPQAYLGIAFGFGIPMAFAALQNQLPFIAWVLMSANIFWVIAYDTAYAMTDREDDLKLGIKTAAITFARYDILAIMLCHTSFIAILTVLGLLLSFSLYYFMGIGAAIILIGYQYQLIRQRDPQRCFQAFLHNNWVGFSIFAGIVAHYHFAPV